MLQKADIRHLQYGSYPSRPIRNHPIFRTAGLDFAPHPARHDSPASTNLPSKGHLILWRFRADWRSASRDEAYSWLSVAERERAKHYPNPALAKRYLVGRATVRQILSRMLDCGPGTVVLGDGADGQPLLYQPEPRSALCIHITYAGVWIIVGLSVTEIGIAASVPVTRSIGIEEPPITNLRTDTAALPEQLFAKMTEPLQQHVRHASLSRLASLGILAPKPAIAVAYGAAAIVDTETEQRCHILDLPMPGKIAAAVALPQIVTRVDAFGWIKD
jgi:hypothetical protein